MRVLIVYETLWGNTGRIADRIAQELSKTCDVETRRADEAPESTEGFDVLIVGAPTHAFSLPRPSTRESAQSRDPRLTPSAEGVREWLAALTPSTVAIPALAFDTRTNAPRVPGSAAKVIRRELKSLGFDTEVRGKSFHVHDLEGPLVDGELDRAAEWAAHAVPLPTHR